MSRLMTNVDRQGIYCSFYQKEVTDRIRNIKKEHFRVLVSMFQLCYLTTKPLQIL